MTEENPNMSLARALSSTLGISVQSQEAEQLEQKLKDMCNNAFAHGFTVARNAAVMTCVEADATALAEKMSKLGAQ